MANRTNWLADGPYFECCKAALAMQYPGTDISALTDKNGRFNAGLTLDSKLKEPSAWNLVCMQWSTLNGTSWSGWIGPETDVTP